MSLYDDSEEELEARLAKTTVESKRGGASFDTWGGHVNLNQAKLS